MPVRHGRNRDVRSHSISGNFRSCGENASDVRARNRGDLGIWGDYGSDEIDVRRDDRCDIRDHGRHDRGNVRVGGRRDLSSSRSNDIRDSSAAHV